MKREEIIRRYGVEEYKRRLECNKERAKKWNAENPDKVQAMIKEIGRKGGKYYEKHLKDKRTGLPGEKNRIRGNHGYIYKPYKQIIAPDSQLHHQWRPESASYDGVALVEKDQHMHGFIDVIEILEGEITLFTEEEVRNH